jgi:hypothetical protein
MLTHGGNLIGKLNSFSGFRHPPLEHSPYFEIVCAALRVRLWSNTIRITPPQLHIFNFLNPFLSC